MIIPGGRTPVDDLLGGTLGRVRLVLCGSPVSGSMSEVAFGDPGGDCDGDGGGRMDSEWLFDGENVRVNVEFSEDEALSRELDLVTCRDDCGDDDGDEDGGDGEVVSAGVEMCKAASAGDDEASRSCNPSVEADMLLLASEMAFFCEDDATLSLTLLALLLWLSRVPRLAAEEVVAVEVEEVSGNGRAPSRRYFFLTPMVFVVTSLISMHLDSASASSMEYRSM